MGITEIERKLLKGSGGERRLAYRKGEAARLLGISLATVNRRIADGSLTAVKVKGCVLLDPASVAAMASGAQLQGAA
jgi:excisionase family DNA binding protein